jgi:hypothetical protein
MAGPGTHDHHREQPHATDGWHTDPIVPPPDLNPWETVTSPSDVMAPPADDSYNADPATGHEAPQGPAELPELDAHPIQVTIHHPVTTHERIPDDGATQTVLVPFSATAPQLVRLCNRDSGRRAVVILQATQPVRISPTLRALSATQGWTLAAGANIALAYAGELFAIALTADASVDVLQLAHTVPV